MAGCSTVYGITVLPIYQTVSSTQIETITEPSSLSTFTSTSETRVCAPCSTAVSATSVCTPSCSTSTLVSTGVSTIAGSVSTSTAVQVATLTSYSTSSYIVSTSCPATTAAVLAATTGAPAPVTTPAPTHSSSSIPSSLSVSTVVVTTTLPNGMVSAFSSTTPVLVPAGQDTSGSNGSSSAPTGAIVGAVLGGAAAALLIVLFAFGCLRRKGPFACLRSTRDDPDGLDEEYWAPAIASTSVAEDEDVFDKAGGGRASISIGSHSHEDMVEYPANGGFHRRSLSAGAAMAFQRSSSTFSYLSDPGRPRSPPLSYPAGPPSIHSSPSYYNYPNLVTTSAQGPVMYYPAPYPVTTADYHAGVVRRPSAASLPPPTMGVTAMPLHYGVQRSRSAHSARTMSYMQGHRLSQWEEGEEPQNLADDTSTGPMASNMGSPLSPVPAEGLMPFSTQHTEPAEEQVLTEGSWLGGLISERSAIPK